MNDGINWRTEPLGQIAHLTMGQSPDSKYYSEDESGWSFLQGCADFQSHFPTPRLFCSIKGKIGKRGSILFSVRAPVGRINIADRDYVIGRGLAAIEASKVARRYLEQYLYFVAPSFTGAVQGSTFEAINSNALAAWPISYPSRRSEQEKLSEVLSSVDQAIAQTEAFIAKQQRINAGLVQDLLTRGIDEHGNLRSEQTHTFRESPLGQIPHEWDVVTLDSVAQFVTSGSRGWAQYYSAEGALFLRIGNLTREHINLRFDDVVCVDPPKSSEGERTSVLPGDLLISITADLGIIGVIASGFETAYVNQHIALVRLVSGKADPRFLGWFLSSRVGQAQFEAFNESGAKAGLNLPTVKRLLFPTMTLAEQERIAAVLDANIEHTAVEYQRLAKLRSLKTGLMQDLLTGRKRVTPLLAAGDEAVQQVS